MVGAAVSLHHITGGAFLDVHTFVGVRSDRVLAYSVVVRFVRTVRPLPVPNVAVTWYGSVGACGWRRKKCIEWFGGVRRRQKHADSG